ncbi:hypothetical protein YC2023_028536 [Brassica napus]
MTAIHRATRQQLRTACYEVREVRPGAHYSMVTINNGTSVSTCQHLVIHTPKRFIDLVPAGTKACLLVKLNNGGTAIPNIFPLAPQSTAQIE